MFGGKLLSGTDAALVLVVNLRSQLRTTDARIKLILLVTYIGALSLLPRLSPLRFCFSLGLIAGLFAVSGVSVSRALRDAFLLLPFVGLFAAILYLSGDKSRALTVLEKCYLSGLAVLLVRDTTRLPRLLEAARFFRIPALLIQSMQLTFRYLTVLKGEALAMQTAMNARRGVVRRRALLPSAGVVAVLFLSSVERSDRVFQAMVSRGYSQTHAYAPPAPARVLDFAVLSIGLLMIAAIVWVP